MCSNVLHDQQRRKMNTKPRDATTPHGNTAAESVRNLLKKNPKYSKRINYDALKDLFVESGGSSSVAAKMRLGAIKDDDDLYTFDDEKDEDRLGMVIIEEEPGSVAVTPASSTQPRKISGAELGENADADADADGDGDEGSDYGPENGWEDAYEQEI